MRFRTLLIALLLLNSMFIVQGRAASPTPDIAFQIPSGDWTIGPGESITIEGETIELKGNLTIESGGSLTLRDHAKLIINSSYNGQYKITVKEGGNFNVIDSEVSAPEIEYTGKIEYNLQKGRNFISVPFKRDNNSVESVLAPLKGRYYKAYVYDPSDASDPWKFYTPGMNKNHSDEVPSYTLKFHTENVNETPPSVLVTLPENGAENVSKNPFIELIFDKSMDTSRIPILTQQGGDFSKNWTFTGWNSSFAINDTALWTWNGGYSPSLPNGYVVNLTVSNYSSIHHTIGPNYSWGFEIISNPHFPETKVTSSIPNDGASSVNPMDLVSVVFNREMNTSFIPSINVLGGANPGNWTFLGWSNTTLPNDTATWSHSPFESCRKIILSISESADIDGYSVSNYYWSFFVRDTTVPNVKKAYPFKTDSFVETESAVTVIFNESMNTTTIPEISQTEGRDPGNWTFIGWKSTYLSNDTAVWSHDPWDDFENITLAVYNYSDIAGNIGPLYSWSFRTGDSKTPQIEEIYPRQFEEEVSVKNEVKVVFDSTMNQAVIPEISCSGSNTTLNWTFLGWQSTYLPFDTAVWEHDNWSSETEITLKISNYSDLSEILPWQGVFVYLYENYSFNLSGAVESDMSAQLYPGWNALGYPFLDNSSVGEVFSSISSHYDEIKTYNGDNETYLNNSDIVEPGKAYWVHVDTGCMWSVSAYSLLELESIFPKFAWEYENGSSGNVQNSMISGCGYDEDFPGLMIFSDLVKVGDTEIKNSYAGVYIEDASPILSENDIHGAHYGIISKDASPIISQNEVYDNKEGGVRISGGFPIVSSNAVSFNTGFGISASDSTVIMDSNTVDSNNGDGVLCSNSTIFLYSSALRYNNKAVDSKFSNITVRGNTISGNQIGVYASVSEVNISGNDFSLNKYDIKVQNGTGGRIEGNSMSSSERSHISCGNDSSPLIYNNIIISGDSGIYVSGSNPVIEKNIIGQNKGSGIHLQKGSDSRIKNNVITNNGWAGVYVDSSSPIIENNTLSSNDFGIASFNATPEIRNDTISNNRWYGLSFIYSKANIENTVLSENKWYGILTSYSSFTMRNVSISESTYQLYLTHSSRATSINSTLSQEKSHLDASSILYVKYFLNIHVNDTLGNMVSNATYRIMDRDGYPIRTGMTLYGKALYIPLTAYVRTFAGISDLENPYRLTISKDGEYHNRTFFVNSTVSENFSFEARSYSVKEDCGKVYLFNIYEWVPKIDNSSFDINGSFSLRCELQNGSFFIDPVKDWNGDAQITVVERKGNKSIGQYRFVIHVSPVNDPPRLEGENPAYSSDKETVFKITYSDPENSLPLYVRVVINGKAHDMVPENPGDYNVADGKTYVYRADLPDGTYTYYFICSDGENLTSTEETELTVRQAFSLPMWAVYILLLTGILVVLYVSVKIRRLKRETGIELESIRAEEKEKKSSEIPSPAGVRRSIWRRKRSGIDAKNVGMDTSSLVLDSQIDRRGARKEGPPAAVSSGDEKEAQTIVDTDVREEVAEKGLPLSQEVGEHSEEVAKKKFSHSTYIQMQKKHRKLRVLLEERDKYATLKPEEDTGEKLPGMEESVDEILKSLKGDE